MSEIVNNGREWPDNNPIRVVEDQQLLNDIAMLMLEQHTPHAVGCGDKACANAMGEADWVRYYALEELVFWLKHKGLSLLLERRMKDAS